MSDDWINQLTPYQEGLRNQLIGLAHDPNNATGVKREFILNIRDYDTQENLMTTHAKIYAYSEIEAVVQVIDWLSKTRWYLDAWIDTFWEMVERLLVDTFGLGYKDASINEVSGHLINFMFGRGGVDDQQIVEITDLDVINPYVFTPIKGATYR